MKRHKEKYISFTYKKLGIVGAIFILVFLLLIEIIHISSSYKSRYQLNGAFPNYSKQFRMPAPEPTKKPLVYSVTPMITIIPAANDKAVWKAFFNANSVYPPYQLDYLSTWKLQYNTFQGSSNLTLTKDNYKILISQGGRDGYRCIFNGVVPTGAYILDLRNEKYKEINSELGILRRYITTWDTGNPNLVMIDFCQLENGEFKNPLVGGINYIVPKQYSDEMLQEMDSIVKKIHEVHESFNEAATFTVPPGWKIKEDNESVISFISPDFDESPRPEITNGAEITIGKYARFYNGDLASYILDVTMPMRGTPYTNKDIKSFFVDNNKAAAIFNSWEESIINNYITFNNYLWFVEFKCAPDCRSEGQFFKNKHYEEMKQFLNSIKFKT